MPIGFRNAEREDVPKVLSFIRKLAEYEKLAHEVEATEQMLEKYLFGEKRYAEVIFASLDEEEVGFALFFHNFSTFLGKPGIYLEDLYVLPEYRKRGVGTALLRRIARLAKERGCGRVEWWVLDWNPARKFYESIGAKAMDDWIVYRLKGDELAEVAENR
ncbi:MAG TPA: GNAT family N-acetyltransferase [Bacteroidales bacterium]|nr:GNAT family N-acetyltransferase [Bacteroidales bacterium]